MSCDGDRILGTKTSRRCIQPRPAAALLLACLLWPALPCDAAVPAAEEAAAIELDLPAGPLAGMLLEIGRRYGAIVSFDPRLTEQRTTPSVQGRHTLAQALAQVLRGTGLVAEAAAGGAYTLRRAPQAASPAAPPSASPAPAPLPDLPRTPQDSMLPPVVVIGQALPESGVKAASTATATFTDTPLSQVPQLVSVMTSDTVELSGARTLDGVLGYAGGVNLISGATPLGGVPALIRGMQAQYALDGLPSGRGMVFGVDSAVIDRVEILKGPSGVVGGVAEDGGRGGVINIVRKRPHAGASTRAQASMDTGDGGLLRTEIDLNRGDAVLAGRMVGYETRGGRTDAGYDGVRVGGLYGSLAWNGDAVGITVAAQIERRREPPSSRVRLNFNVDPETQNVQRVIAGREFAVVRDDGTDTTMRDAEVDLRWRMSDRWRLTLRGRHEHGTADLRQHTYVDVDDESAAVDFGRLRIDVPRSEGLLLLTGDIETGNAGSHRLLLGAAAQDQRLDISSRNASWTVDPRSFVPGQSELGAPDASEDSDVEQWRIHQRSLIVQDEIRFGGLRLRLAVSRVAFTEENGSDRHPKGRNWDAGASYALTPRLTVYAGAQAALEATTRSNDVRLPDGSTAPFTQLRQTQAGLKWDDGRLGMTLEAFRLKQRNKLTFDASLAEGAQAPAPGRQASGIEFDLTGQVSPSLDLVLGLNLMSAKDVYVDSGQVQPFVTPAVGAPERSMRLLARYRPGDAFAPGTRFGAAFRAQSAAWVIAPAPVEMLAPYRVPGGALLDLSWMRDVGPWSFSVAVRNVFDRRLVGVDYDPNRLPVLSGRSLQLTAAWQD